MTNALSQRLGARIRELPGVEEGPSRFGGGRRRAWIVGGREFAHLHAEDRIDIRLPRAAQRELREDPRAQHRATPSAWIEFRFRTEDDVRDAFELVECAWRSARDGAG